MDTTPESGDEPANLRFLRRLVTGLTGVMIVGLLTLIGLFVMRFRADMVPVPLPDQITLPEGARPVALTAGRGWYAVVTEDDRILIFDADGQMQQEVEVRQAQ